MIFLIALLNFSLRAVPRLFRKNAMDSDTYFHMFYANEIRENGFKVPLKFHRILLNHKNDYPFFYHYLLAVFPIRFRVWVERLTSSIFDTISLLIVYFFSLWAINVYSDFPSQFNKLPIWTAVLFAFSPALLRVGAGPRANSGSPRVVGQSLYLLHILMAYVAFSSENIAALIISLLAGGVLIFTAKFGNQVFLFFGIFFCIFVSPYYLLLIMGSFFLAAIMITRARLQVVLVGHVKHSIFFYKELQHILTIPRIVTFRKYVWHLKEAFGNFRSFRIGQVLQWFFCDESYYPHYLFTVVPQFMILIFGWPSVFQTPLNRFLFVWCVAGLLCFFITKYKMFVFLGEGERYLEYALFPSIFLSVQYLLQQNKILILYIWLGYSVFCALFYIQQYLKNTVDDFDETEPLFTRLNAMPEGVIWPIAWFHWQTLCRSKFPILTIGGGVDTKLLPIQEFKLVYENYPFPSENYRQIIERYNITYIITNQHSLDHYLQKIVKQSEDFLSLIEDEWRAGPMILLKVKW